MSNIPSTESFNVCVLGSVAKVMLSSHDRGEVLAVFRRTFYVAFGTDVVCIGAAGLGAGPLNALCPLPDDLHWPDTGLGQKDEVICANATVLVGRRVRFRFGDAYQWRAPAPAEFSLANLRLGLRRLAASARRRQPGGLGALLGGVCDGAPLYRQVKARAEPVLRVAATPIDAMCRWLASALLGSIESPPEVDTLIGLGGGLTPSCDDFFCGIMVALHHLGRSDIAAQLANRVLPVAACNTNLISAAYLRCAAAGEASAALYDAVECILSDSGRLDDRLDVIGSVGHTSGWDMLVGVAAVCAAFVVAAAPAAMVG